MIFPIADSKQSQAKVDELIVAFLNTHHQPESIRQVIDLTSALFTNTIQIALKDPILVSNNIYGFKSSKKYLTYG